MHHQKKHHHIVDIEWPCALSTRTRMKLLKIATSCHDGALRKPSAGIFYVASGCLINYMTTSAANNSLGLVLGSGSWFGIQSIHCTEQIYEVYEFMQPSEILFFPKKSIEALLEEEPELYVFLFRIAQKMSRFGFQLTCNTLRCLKGRVIYTLLHLAESCVENSSGERVIHTTQCALGRIVGATRPRVNEVLKELAEVGVIHLGRGKITLLRLDFLQGNLTPSEHPYYLPKLA